MSDAAEAKLGELISKCMADPAFKARFKADPAAVLNENGMAVPAGVNVHVVENSDSDVYFALPAAPSTGGEISDADLEAVAGGALTFGPAIFRRVLWRSTTNQNINTCGKSCIPW